MSDHAIRRIVSELQSAEREGRLVPKAFVIESPTGDVIEDADDDDSLNAPDSQIEVEDNPYGPKALDGSLDALEAAEEYERPTDELAADELDEHAEMHQRAEELLGADGAHVSDIVRMATVEEMRAEISKRDAPWVRTNPKSIRKSNNGAAATVRPGQDPVEVCRWLGDDDEVTAATVTFGPASPYPPGGVGAIVEAFVRIKWGAFGVNYQADIDAGYGGQLTLNASFVQVLVGILADPNVDQSLLAPFRLSASIGFTPCVRTTPLTSTSVIWNLAGGTNTGRIQRPNFATAVRFERDDPTLPFSLLFNNNNFSGGSPFVIYKRSLGGGQFLDQPIPLSIDCSSVQVSNDGGGASNMSGRLFWILAL